MANDTLRTDREILKIAMDNVANLTNKEYERYIELQKMSVRERYGKAHGGKVRGRMAASTAETSTDG